ncbi:MAG: hypothetical protein F4Y08_15810 [Caldilineaceae bacterium SB0662_bin_9]|uniref:Uncharacterized protein n=1 Tax=Caldilineaceae bacterium SB0662_bin_9 TaxID=2605258 RepID=A0A6B1DYJ9_9CHLR|nr:hypothetical protein [Caldilineaceae bacterium SB0662_bin_9]
MSSGVLSLISIILALLVLVVVSGTGFAGGSLFGGEYSDCPFSTRLRDGQISGLSLSRDADREDEVDVSWTAIDPASWGLGPNVYRTSLVVMLDDDSTHTRTLPLGSRKTTFTGVEIDTKVTVQLAIVVEAADGDYLISNILEQSINHILTEPAFMTTEWKQGVTPPTAKKNVPLGTFYYVGYNEAFGNYKAESGLLTRPQAARLRIGLAHGEEDDRKRNNVDFDTYIIRITDEDGDVVPEGNDVAAMASNYGTKRLVTWCIIKDLSDNTDKFTNVRVNDGGVITGSMYATSPPFVTNPSNQALLLKDVVSDKAEDKGVSTAMLFEEKSLIEEHPIDSSDTDPSGANTFLYAMPPDAHRDFPIDVLANGKAYTITAWAVNDGNEVISPIASLKVRPTNVEYGEAISDIQDYVSLGEVSGGVNSNVKGFTVTTFTVIR